jgi:hypothetical protein
MGQLYLYLYLCYICHFLSFHYGDLGVVFEVSVRIFGYLCLVDDSPMIFDLIL